MPRKFETTPIETSTLSHQIRLTRTSPRQPSGLRAIETKREEKHTSLMPSLGKLPYAARM